MKEENLKNRRAELLKDLINEIKKTIEKKKIKGELSNKIDIYNRLSDYTYYSEVSIRKFLTGAVPKDITSFVEGIIQYCKWIEMNEEYIDNFVKEYIIASNAIMIESNTMKVTRNNLIPQDLTKIVRTRKLTKFLDEFISGNIPIAYIYGYRLSGKTKSVMTYCSDFVHRNLYDNVIWVDINGKENQVEQLIHMIYLFLSDNKNIINQDQIREAVIQFLNQNQSLLILDFANFEIQEEVFYILKQFVMKTKVILLTSIPFHTYENHIEEYAKVFCMNNFIEKDELLQMLSSDSNFNKIVSQKANIIDDLYRITRRSSFCC